MKKFVASLSYPPRCCRRRREASVEHYGLSSVHEDAVFEMQPQRAGEDKALEVSPFPYQVVEGVLVGNSNDILFDDRSLR